MRRGAPLAVGSVLVIALVGACGGNDTATTASTTVTPPTSAPEVVADDSGFEIAGYKVASLEPTQTGLTVPPELEGVVGYRYAKDGTEVAVGIQGLLPESESPNDASLKAVLGEVSGGGTPVEIAIGEQKGLEVTGFDGRIYIGNILEDGTVNVVRGTDKDAMVAMLVALTSATSSVQ